MSMARSYFSGDQSAKVWSIMDLLAFWIFAPTANRAKEYNVVNRRLGQVGLQQ